MPKRASPFRITSTHSSAPRGLRDLLLRTGGRLAEKLLALDDLTRIYEQLPDAKTPTEFLEVSLAAFNITADLTEAERARVPSQGPMIAVANHPFGGVEGLLLARELLRIRPDVKMLANFLLTRIPELAPMIVQADPFAEGAQSATNHRAVKESLAWLKGGGCLLVFPAGEVSSMRWGRREVVDPAWNPSFLRLARRANAVVTPIFVHGQNGLRFQAAGLVHPRLRTALLPRELLNKANRRIKVSIGKPLAVERLTRFDSEGAATQWVRETVYLLARAATSTPATIPAAATSASGAAIITKLETDDARIRAEVMALDESRWIAHSGRFSVFFANAQEIPTALKEVARLREITFRAVGEGTGRSLDTDEFDSHYTHVVLWDQEEGTIAGGYRLGLTDRILQEHGLSGLYTHQLFRYRRRLLEKLHPAVELGRSFVVEQHQRSYVPLLLLWRGITKYVARHPNYRYVFGPVSISNAYSSGSQTLLVQFLKAHLMAEDLTGLVRPKRPFRAVNERLLARLGPHVGIGTLLSTEAEMDKIGGLIEDLEADGKSVPVLLRQCVKLGGRILGFNVDADFGNSIDCLIVVDLAKADERSLKRYMGNDEYEEYIRHHRPSVTRESA